jgi:ParE toxin of type II toxin-antitoxin system, parDE
MERRHRGPQDISRLNDCFPTKDFQLAKVFESTDVRVIVLSPYLIFYRFEKAENKVEILRFWHGARDPLSLEL